jgi:hypothetical protein
MMAVKAAEKPSAVPNWEVLGYTPGVLAESAQTVERKRDELNDSAKEREREHLS